MEEENEEPAGCGALPRGRLILALAGLPVVDALDAARVRGLRFPGSISSESVGIA